MAYNNTEQQSDRDSDQKAGSDPAVLCGCELIPVLRSAAVVVIGALRHPVRTLRHCSRFCSLKPYREVSESTEEASPSELRFAASEDQLNNNDTEDSKCATSERPKRTRTKRMKKKLKKSVQRYGDSAMLTGSPIGGAFIARDIQERISASNYKYVEMRGVYTPSYGVFL